MADEAKKTLGPWSIHSIEDGGTTYVIVETCPDGEQFLPIAHIATIIADGCAVKRDEAKQLTIANLIAAAPDHAMFLSALVRGLIRWEPLVGSNVNSGEVCCRGLRYVTRLDGFGCPAMTPHIRVAITKAAEGGK